VIKDIVIKFPNSKRKLTSEEESVLSRCVNLIELTYKDKNPFIRSEQRQMQAEGIIRECIKKIFELNEDKK
jgi:hypothetical protein